MAIFSTIFSCEKDTPMYKIKNLNGNKVSALGHGGSGISWKFPIDTWESIQECLNIGADGTEMDIQMTKDSVLVVFHDEKLENATSCIGLISEKKWSEIGTCLYNSPLSSHIDLMRAEDVFSRINNLNKYLFTFDCKFYTSSNNTIDYFNQFANAIIALVEKYQLEKNLLIESQNLDFLRIIQNKKNDLKLFIYPADFEEGLKIAQDLNLFGITIDSKLVTEKKIALAHEKGLRVAIWNIETQEENLSGLQKSPDYIQSDKIHHLVKITGKNIN